MEIGIQNSNVRVGKNTNKKMWDDIKPYSRSISHVDKSDRSRVPATGAGRREIECDP